MTDRPPTRYDEEGKSLPERGSGRPALEAALAKQQSEPEETETLLIPAGQVMWLLMKAFATPEGDAWMRGFITAKGEPKWVIENHWGLRAGDAEIVKVSPQMTNGTIPSARP